MYRSCIFKFIKFRSRHIILKLKHIDFYDKEEAVDVNFLLQSLVPCLESAEIQNAALAIRSWRYESENQA
jgi:hypothetical protein